MWHQKCVCTSVLDIVFKPKGTRRIRAVVIYVLMLIACNRSVLSLGTDDGCVLVVLLSTIVFIFNHLNYKVYVYVMLICICIHFRYVVRHHWM